MSAGFDSSVSRGTGPTRYFTPGSVAGSGSVLWVLDVSHPVLLRRDADGTIGTFAIPGEIRGSGIVGWRVRWLHADESGCWVVGADGIVHCDHSGAVRLIDPAPVSVSGLVDGVLATARTGDRDGNALIRLRTLDATEWTATVTVPGDVDDIQPTRGGFLVSMRTGTDGPVVIATDRGQWCARLGLDGALALGDPWPRRYWSGGDVSVVDVGAPVAVSSSRSGSQVLGDRLAPVAPMRFTSEFRPFPVASGAWLVQQSASLARQCGNRNPAPGCDRKAYAYFGLNSHLTAPAVWATAEGYPKDLTVTDGDGRLWIVTTAGLFASDPGAVAGVGAIEMSAVGPGELPMPELAIRPPSEVGDPERWAETERARLLDQNRGQGLLDVEIDGWFPHTSLFVTFTVAGLPGVTCARRYTLFDRDGRPALWRGPPTLMESIRTDIAESGGVERLAHIEPGRFGWVWT